ncbi:MAG: peptidoglycan D,D-transpeptidase FtsI family protein [Flavobacteriales bacterium]
MNPQLEGRKFVILLIFIVTVIIFIMRLLYIQVIDDKWAIRAQDISEEKKIVYPARGLIFDRNGELLVSTSPVYDIMITPKKLGEIDTLELCKVLGIAKEDFDRRIEIARNWPNVPYKASVFMKEISLADYAKIGPKLIKYNGIEGVKKTLRGYPTGIASHVMGYIREISREELDADTSNYYRPGDYVGKSGLEKEYEKELRGKRGLSYFLRDVTGIEKSNIRYEEATAGNNIYITIDAALQAYGEKLMANKMGSIVAIEPSTGEILCMVSAPTIDPNRLVGRDFGKYWGELASNDSLKPLINRAIYPNYRPGSIFKLVQSLVAMQEGVITANTGFACNKSYVGCHNHPPAQNVAQAIQHSCNPYYYSVYSRMIQQGKARSIFVDSRIGLSRWRNHLESFGLGTALKTDIPGVGRGFIPDTSFYDKWYGKNRWAFTTIYSNSIGEGEIGVVPLQMANFAAVIANKGYYYTPHLVKKIGKDGLKREEYLMKNYTTVDPKHFEPVIEGMALVVTQGTGRRAQVEGITVCGKTGTVQNNKYNDHSVFIAFAPREDPKIAVAVYVEYGTWGGTWAAPIASLIIEKYLRGEITGKNLEKEKRALETTILTKNAKF